MDGGPPVPVVCLDEPDRTRALREDEASACDATARGIPVWLGLSREGLRLVAVICPLGTMVTGGLVRSWKERDVEIVVETEAEAAALPAAARTLTRAIGDGSREPADAMGGLNESPAVPSRFAER